MDCAPLAVTQLTKAQCNSRPILSQCDKPHAICCACSLTRKHFPSHLFTGLLFSHFHAASLLNSAIMTVHCAALCVRRQPDLTGSGYSLWLLYQQPHHTHQCTTLHTTSVITTRGNVFINLPTKRQTD